jgi:hypothetical protein
MTDKTRAHFAQLKSAEAQDQPSVGAQAGAAGVVALPVGGMGHDILEALALIGNAQLFRADDRGDQADCAPLAQCTDLLNAPYHQRRRRGPELQDRYRPETRLRLAQSEPLQDRCLFPLRWPQPISGCGDSHENWLNFFQSATIGLNEATAPYGVKPLVGRTRERSAATISTLKF